jgi:hypothetical protein
VADSRYSLSKSLSRFPIFQNVTNRTFYSGTSIPPVITPCEEFVVFRFGMTYVSDDGKAHSLFVETLSCRCSTDPTAIFQTGMFCYLIFPPRGAIREEFTYS